MLDKIMNSVGVATEIGIKLIGLAIILQIIFGHSVAFLGGSTISTIIGIVTQLGDAGLVGILSVLILWKLLTKD
jgi:hypothetical protein|tara:strand:+ start:86 stop:307 length:222 start_codon:yes stop_codon:yes gene_type:complete